MYWDTDSCYFLYDANNPLHKYPSNDAKDLPLMLGLVMPCRVGKMSLRGVGLLSSSAPAPRATPIKCRMEPLK